MLECMVRTTSRGATDIIRLDLDKRERRRLNDKLRTTCRQPPGKKNLEHLAAALKDLDARVYTESVPEGLHFDRSAVALARASTWNLVTNAGRLDIAFMPSGTKGYEDLASDAEKFEAFGVRFLAASLDDIIRSKEATGRAKDEDDVVILRALKRRAK